MPGAQNVSNALGVVALATELGIAWNQIVSALAEFRGASRRFEVKYHSADYMVVDDYAHHPTEIKATLAAAKKQRLQTGAGALSTAPLSAHQGASGRIRRGFPRCCRRISSPKFTPPVKRPWRASPANRLPRRCARTGTPRFTSEPTLARLRAAVNAVLEPGDLVITLGAGNIHRVAQHLAQGLAWYAELGERAKPGSILKRDEPLHKHTTMRIGGPAQLWFEPVDEEDLQLGLRFAHDRGIPVTFIGRGSNLLVRDGGILGLCVHWAGLTSAASKSTANSSRSGRARGSSKSWRRPTSTTWAGLNSWKAFPATWAGPCA